MNDQGLSNNEPSPHDPLLVAAVTEMRQALVILVATTQAALDRADVLLARVELEGSTDRG